MISERVFAHVFKDFWRSVMPRCDQMTAMFNITKIRILSELESTISIENRGLINESAVRFARRGFLLKLKLKDISDEQLRIDMDEAKHFIDRFRSESGVETLPLTEEEVSEARQLAQRLLDMLAIKAEEIDFYVSVPGVGIIDPCIIDGVSDSSIVEVKAGRRPFRSEDIRQGLVYAAMHQLSHENSPIRNLCMMNPRLGWYAESTFENLIQSAGGPGWPEFLYAFENYVTENRMMDDGSGMIS